jgi:hypothetical protein
VTEPWNLESLVIQDSILVCSPDPRIPHTADCVIEMPWGLIVFYPALPACLPVPVPSSAKKKFSLILFYRFSRAVLKTSHIIHPTPAEDSF